MVRSPLSSPRGPWLPSIGLWRAVVHRSRADLPVVLAAWVLLLCSITLLVAGALYADAVALGGLRRAVLAAPAADRTIAVRLSAGPKEIDPFDAVVSRRLTDALGSGGGEVDLTMRSGSLLPAGVSQEAASANLTLLASLPAIAEHASLVAGQWPSAGQVPLEATLSEGAAHALGLGVADRIRLVRAAGAADGIDLAISGIWRPNREDPYWRDDPLELDGTMTNGAFTTRGPFVVSEDDVRAQGLTGDLALEWRALPAVDGIRLDGLNDLRQAIDGLPQRLRDALPTHENVQVKTALPTILASVDRSILVSRSGIILLTLEFSVLAGYAIILVAGMLLERRRAETALFRARGATAGHVVALAFGEALILVAAATALAPWLALGLIRALGAVGPLSGQGIVSSVGISGQVVLVAVVAGLACLLILTLPALAAGAFPVGIRASLGRPLGRTLPQRLGLDFALVVLALIALWQLRLYGAPLTRDTYGLLGIDPLLVAAPAVGLLAGAILATRLVPRLAELGERILGRRRGLVPPLGARQLARRPLRYTRAALLLVLAFALGTYAASSAATWSRSQADQAAYRVAADARAIPPEYAKLPDWATGSAYREVAGVSAATPIERDSVAVGRAVRDGQLLAVDAAAVGSLFAARPGAIEPAVSDALSSLAAARPTLAAIDIPGRPRRLALTIDADLHGQPDPGFGFPVGLPASTFDFPPDERDIAFSVVLSDSDGNFHRFDGGDAKLVGRGQRLDLALDATVAGVVAEPAYPLRLEAIEVIVRPPYAGPLAVGSIDLRSLSESNEASGDSFRPISFDPGSKGLEWMRQDGDGIKPWAAPTDAPGRIQLRTDDGVGSFFGPSGDTGVTFRLWAPAATHDAVPAIAGSAFLNKTGAHVGDTIAVNTTIQGLKLTIVAAADGFPPLDPGVPFVVVDGPSIGMARLVDTWTTMTSGEWWLTVEPGRQAEVAAALKRPPYSATVIDRDTLTRDLAGDPIQLGILGALALGALAATAIAAIGFLVSAAVSASERIGELALLRALGLSGRELSIWLAMEHAFLLLIGLLAGTALGVVLAWLVLPFATLSETGRPPIPRPVPVVPWEAIGLLALLAMILFLATVLVLVRLMPGPRVGGIIRSTEVT